MKNIILEEDNEIMEMEEQEDAGLKEGGGLISEEARRLLDVKAYLGLSTSKTNPKMKPFIVGSKNGLEIIDIDKTAEMLAEARKVAADLAKQGKKLLFVSSSPIFKEVVEAVAEKSGNPFVSGRWIGGLITNFKMLSKRLKYFRDLREKDEKGDLKKYTKKEQFEFKKEIEKMSKLFGGLENYSQTPDALAVIDVEADIAAIKEAKLKNLPVIAIVNTNINPETVAHPIPAANHFRSSVEYILNELAEAYNRGKESKDEGREEEVK